MTRTPILFAAALAIASSTAAARASQVVPPDVPTNLAVSSDFKPFLIGHAIGTQNYVCQPGANGVVQWVLFGPQATLFDDQDGQMMTHFLSANPMEGLLPRPTWQHSRDTSAVWARLSAQSSDAAFVAPGAIPWFKLEVVGFAVGPGNGDRLTRARFIQRVNTAGGLPDATACVGVSDIGKRVLVPYAADYVFYR